MAKLIEELESWVRLWHTQFIIWRAARAYDRYIKIKPRMEEAIKTLYADHKALKMWHDKQQEMAQRAKR